jgi:hypothetical protein
MKVIEVKIVLGHGFDSWTQYFSEYPSLETIKLRLRGRKQRGHPNLFDFATRLNDDNWVTTENPDKLSQAAFCCGVWVGAIEMSEKDVYICGEQQIMKIEE